ncbi:transcriptional corepressor of histone-like protein genes [Lindgomyces ingoldianus]|uniref:Transcriptional corepressor of histone-like protein genes n=1 Tax=Lindgomyces ingoldianus TaxID=673940 RepID=A0ACB6R1Y3_9PLEO|nr:transcriptional corepressor of histone-like protein genes [Lindgomyces ingoldianus]KAF2473329.1 transcriptional corepressor of histone-like protein genes [Lindgomyces ingoldianus]
MSAFKALNVESDNESEDEVDNTKEIQIEDALKLYQTALKYHSEGPPSFDKAADAYKALFNSEIFKYTESLSEYKRHELFGENLEFDNILQDEFESGPVQLVGGNESAPNTLPQILHLSYKNHGQFMLETMQHWLREHGAVLQLLESNHVILALTYFAEALDKEDTDLDLWIRTASVAALLGSRRITRFCLEAVLDGDDELLGSILRLPGLEEGFAGQQLRELVEKLEDNVSLMQAPLSSMKRKKLSETLKKRLNPYPFAPLPCEVAKAGPSERLRGTPERIFLNPSKWDWAAVGEAILHHFMAEQGGFIEPSPGSSLNINIPPDANVDGEDKPNDTPPEEEVVVLASEVTHPVQVPENASATVENAATSAKEGQDVSMEDQDKDLTVKTEDAGSVTPQESAPTQSRKRSTDSAGLPETAEGGRARSKRLRARETVTDGSTGPDSAGPDLAKQIEDQLSPLLLADQYLFEVVNDIFVRLGVEGLGSPKELRDFVIAGEPGIAATSDIDRAACDMYASIQGGGSKIAAVFLSNETVDLGGMSREAGLNAFLGYAKTSTSQACVKPILGNERLAPFAHKINVEWLSAQEVALAWLEALLLPGSLPSPDPSGQGSRSSYMQYQWAEDLKRHLVQIIVNFDDFIYGRLSDRISDLNSRILKVQVQSGKYRFSEQDASQLEMVETLFELHLDIYSLIKHPHSGVDSATQTVQNDRLGRWLALARDALQLRSDCDPDIGLDQLALRHIWASVFRLSVTEEVQPEYVIFSMEELKAIFQSRDGPVIEVQNNAVMPELSIAAIDRELARISMKDFFLRVFDQDDKDPVAVIESLEPILEPIQEIQQTFQPDTSSNDEDQVGSQASSSTVGNTSDHPSEPQFPRPTPFQEMRKFLDTASVSLRLSLWQRLREAYESIEYPPKVMSCYLRSIETLVGEFKSSSYRECQPPERHVRVMSRLRIIDEILVKILQIIRDEKTAFDCLSYEHMQSSMTALCELLRIMNAENIFEDLLRVGQATAPRFEGCPNNTFVTMTTRLHDMQLRVWILQYHLLKEGIAQSPDAFPTPSEDQFEFLRHVHYATGVRGFCHLAGRLFLRLVKDEMLRLDDVMDGNTRDTEVAQVLYDLYGLKTFINTLECHEFSSVPEILDKKTASQLLPFIQSQARKLSIKDLPKTELKVTIDKVHGALGRTKESRDITLNRKMLMNYVKSPITPISLFNCLKGVGSLSTKYIASNAAIPQSKGWFFLMGNIALNKFRSQKRLVPGPTEDIHIAQAFFMQDLEYSIDRWESWYRLAQANDAQIEEAVSWTAEKLNSGSLELIHFQRAAIHCYSMAVACAVRDADVAPQTIAKVSEMYTHFGNRIYASSREPFSMSAFNLRESEQKYYSGVTTMQVYQYVPFQPLQYYTAWKFASALFKRAIHGNPDKWWNYFMLGKCLWKMYCDSENAAADAVAQGKNPPPKGPSWEEVIDAFIGALENLPGKKERREPIMEPHYKLVSIVHKLFQRKAIDHEKGEEILGNTSYSQNIVGPENPDDWERYILAVLKALRAADKSGWHHRMTARAAHVIYDDSNDTMVALAAKHELTQQMFTKTMAVQVWKPEHERPGRHFVYTSRYTRFFVQLLVQTSDRTNLEALAKRVRKKPHEFFEHSKLWQELCLSYLKLLRRVGKIPDGHEDAVFKIMNNDDFQAQAARVEAWCQDPTSQHPTLEVLRDIIELKRLNNGLMKALLIDDLIGDTYALLYATIGPTLVPEPVQPQQVLQLQQSAAMPLGQPPSGTPTVSSMIHVQVDGAGDAHSNPNMPLNIFQPDQHRPPQPETAARSRAKAVGRREIQRKAEAAVAKPVVPISIPAAIPIRSPSLGGPPQLIIPTRISSEKPAAESTPTQANEQLQVPNSGTVTAAGSVVNAESSVPASVHDSADDESELSELDESEVQEIHDASDVHDPETVTVKSMFPNLMANKEKAKENGSNNVESRTGSSEQGTTEEK